MRFDVILPSGEPIAHFEARDKNQGERIGSAYIKRENLPTGTTLRTISPGGIFTEAYRFNFGSRNVLVKAPQSQRPAIEQVKELFDTKPLSYDNLMVRLECIRGAYIETSEL
jgi:hypothetical protein